MNIKSLVKETIREVVLEKQINLFVEKTFQQIHQSGLIISHRRKSLMFIQNHLRNVEEKK